MGTIKSIKRKIKKYNPISGWMRREKEYRSHLERVWGMEEGELERRHRKRIKKISDWVRDRF